LAELANWMSVTVTRTLTLTTELKSQNVLVRLKMVPCVIYINEVTILNEQIVLV